MGGKDGCKERLEAATISGILYLVREILLLSGKRQGIMSVATMVCHIWKCAQEDSSGILQSVAEFEIVQLQFIYLDNLLNI